MKIKKKLAAISTAMVMAVSAMSIGASAATWSLSSSGAHTVSATFTAGASGLTGITDSCTYYYSANGTNGNVAYVRYWAYITESNGTVISGGGTDSYYHYAKQSSHKVPLRKKAVSGNKVIVTYQLENSNITSSMEGTYSTY